MPTDFSRKTCSQLYAYAKGGVAAAASAGCPTRGKAAYQYVLNNMNAGGGCSSNIVNNEGTLIGIRAGLQDADTTCHQEAYGPGGSRSGAPVPSKPAAAVAAGAAAGEGVAKAGISPWLIVGGLGLALLLFGKKARKRSRRRR